MSRGGRPSRIEADCSICVGVARGFEIDVKGEDILVGKANVRD